MDQRIKLLNRLKMQLSGYVYTGHKSRDGWKGELPHYQFECPVHGLVENYPSGYRAAAGVPPVPSREKGEAPEGGALRRPPRNSLNSACHY